MKKVLFAGRAEISAQSAADGSRVSLPVSFGGAFDGDEVLFSAQAASIKKSNIKSVFIIDLLLLEPP